MAAASSKIETTQQHCAGASGMYRLLGRLWLREVDAALLNELQTPPLRELFLEAGGVLPEKQHDSRVVDELAIEYCRLFLGPSGHSPPMQSVWQGGQFQGDPAARMREFLNLLAYAKPTYADETMEDHLGVQLDFMGHLCQRVAATERADEEFTTLQEIAGAFYAEHLRWPSPLLARVEHQAKLPFYQALARMTGEFLASEGESWSRASTRQI